MASGKERSAQLLVRRAERRAQCAQLLVRRRAQSTGRRARSCWAKDIEEALLNSLDTAGFTEEWLQKNCVSFVSDGASVMLGKNSGVATRLTARYPNLFTWHCMNHRLELAVSDAVDEVQAVNHFKVFLEKIHNLYSQSNKNSRELLEAAQEVGSQVLKIGRVLSTRWVASSFRSVKAVWTSYEALNRHFENAAGDQTRSSKERQTYRGLARRMQSKEFLCDLGLMFDALSELANLSQQLQAHSVTLLRADHLLKRTIRVLASFKDTQGEKFEEALTAQALGHLGSVPLESNAKLTPINAKQFLQSLINNLVKRLSFDGEMLHDLSVLDTGNWPSTPGIRHEAALRVCDGILNNNNPPPPSPCWCSDSDSDPSHEGFRCLCSNGKTSVGRGVPEPRSRQQADRRTSGQSSRLPCGMVQAAVRRYHLQSELSVRRCCLGQ
ncbi:hypothetical protein NHX12_000373 [Muraenolepis orangiensis]|uniref:Uncharacterized protein n=1 Tax=Muraenolepis orangiensis TaxID=630683 RepID=A0A9Q0D681_9TELE|nr:hypothetical protein NHX12_000373 [Muraenolepis orangiensis]